MEPRDSGVHDDQTVTFDGRGANGAEFVRFEQEDVAAEPGETDAASCAIKPTGDYSDRVRHLHATFAHVREQRDATPEHGPLGAVDAAWDEPMYTDRGEADGGGA